MRIAVSYRDIVIGDGLMKLVVNELVNIMYIYSRDVFSKNTSNGDEYSGSGVLYSSSHETVSMPNTEIIRGILEDQRKHGIISI